jgi:hypothetical protein
MNSPEQPIETVRLALMRAEDIARSISSLRDMITGARAEQTSPVQASEYGGMLGELQSHAYSVLDDLRGAESNINALAAHFAIQLKPAPTSAGSRRGPEPAEMNVRNAY